MNPKEQPFFKELGLCIARARKQQSMTQEELAKKLGVAQQTLAHYEGARLRVSAAQLTVLADVLNLSLDELLGRKAVAKRRAGVRARKPLH